MFVQKQSHKQCIEEAGGGGVEGNGATIILELDIVQAKLRDMPVQMGFRIFARAQLEIKTNLRQLC